MSWTGRSEAQACCPGADGPVRGSEPIARLLHSKIDRPETARFRRDGELLPPKGRPFSNDCRQQHGASVVRCASLSDDELRARALALACQKPGRDSRGAIVASADALRAIRLEDQPDRQVVFVYDDPRDPEEPFHAVIRVDENLAADFVDIRQEVLKRFSRVVSP